MIYPPPKREPTPSGLVRVEPYNPKTQKPKKSTVLRSKTGQPGRKTTYNNTYQMYPKRTY